MPRVNFDEVVLRVRRLGKCGRCGCRTRLVYKLWQTCNPFNRNADGLPKTRGEIEKELAKEANLERERSLLCRGCQHALVDEARRRS